MNPLVALMIASLTCGTPPMTFRDFYRSYYHAAGPGQSWMGQRGEETATVIRRVMDATADFNDYRVVWAEQCGTKR